MEGPSVFPDVDVALHDGVVGGLVDALGLQAQEGRLEQSLGTPANKEYITRGRQIKRLCPPKKLPCQPNLT
jgi:hypothetical protein